MDDEPALPETTTPDSDGRWAALTRLTPARIGLGRSGASLPTREVLRFGLAHAQARDAVHLPFEADRLEAEIRGLGFATIRLESRATDRALYLRRPDLGRRLSDASRARLERAGPERADLERADLERAGQTPADLAIVVGDGLSSAAVHLNAVPLLAALRPHLDRAGLSVAPVAIATGARVALGDEAAVLAGARAVLVLIGERPGLSAPDSLGAYLTLDARPGRTDAERNCVSNIRAAGLSHAEAAFKLAWLLREAIRLGATGVALKDESDRAHLEPSAGPMLPSP